MSDISCEHTSKTFVVMSVFLFLYLDLPMSNIMTLMSVSFNAPKQFYYFHENCQTKTTNYFQLKNDLLLL